MIEQEGPGNLFECPVQTITCPINTAGAMGAGLALEFKNKVPFLYDHYLSIYPYDPSVGATQAFERRNLLTVFNVNGREERKVLLFPTKIHWRDPSPIDLVRQNLVALTQSYEKLGIRSLGVPMLGCGLGGLDYDRDLRPMLYEHLDPLRLPVFIVTN